MASSTAETVARARWACGVLAVGLLTGVSHASSKTCEVDWRPGRLTLNANDATRASCVVAIARQTGMRVSGLEHLQGTISLTLSTPFIAEVIRRLAGDNSYTMVENDADHAGDPHTLSVRFAGPLTEPSAASFQVDKRIAPAAVALVEDADTGRVEAHSPSPATPVAPGVLPAAGSAEAQVHLED